MNFDQPTERQLEILRFIAREIEVDGFPPTVREIGEEFEINSTNAVADHLRALVRRGLLEQRPRMRARSLKLTRLGLTFLEPGGRCPTCHRPMRSAA